MAQRLPASPAGPRQRQLLQHIVTQQRYNQDLFQATNRSRRLDGNLRAPGSGYSIGVTADRNDYFSDETSFHDDRLAAADVRSLRGEQADRYNQDVFRRHRRIRHAGAQCHDQRRQGVGSGIDARSTSLRRCGSRSPMALLHRELGRRLARNLLDARASTTTNSRSRTRSDDATLICRPAITGPVFNRIWTPNNGYAEKFKHVIEPSLTIHYIPDITNFNQIVQARRRRLPCSGTTQFTYALTNRLYAKKTTSREIANVVADAELLHERERRDLRSQAAERLRTDSADTFRPGHPGRPRRPDRSHPG